MPTQKLDVTIERLRKKLRSSPTAVSSGASPTAKDVELDRQLRKAEEQKSQQRGKEIADRLNKRRVGTEDTGERPGVINRIFKFLNAPVAAGAGVAESLLGQGTKSGVLENIKANIEEGGTYGDVIRQGGVTNWLAMPAGFALDVALDPINWITAGSTAFIPRVGRGLVKGGVEGAEAAAKLSLASKLEGLGEAMMPSRYRAHVWDSAPLEGKMGKVLGDIAEKTKKHSQEYDEIVEGGVSALERLTNKQQTGVDRLISGVGEAINSVKPGATQWMKKHFWGDGKKYIEESKLSEELARAPDASAWEKTKIAKRRQEAMSFYDEGRMLLDGEIPSRTSSSSDVAARMATVMADEMEDAVLIEGKLSDIVEQYMKGNTERAQLLKQMPIDAQRDYLATFTTMRSGVEGFDKAMANKLVNPNTLKFFKGHAKAMALFKAGVIGLSVPARVNQAIGNLVAFVPIAGINPFRAGFAKSLVGATKFSYTRDVKHLRDFLSDAEIMKMLREYPETFTKVTGIKAEFLSEGTTFIRRRVKDLVDKGLDQGTADSMLAHVAKFENDLAKGMGTKEATKKLLEQATSENVERVLREGLGEAKKAATKPFVTAGTEFDQLAGNINITQEFNFGIVAKWINDLEKSAKKGDKGAKALAWYLKKPLEDYGRGDQIFKLGVMMHLTRNGISEGEMKVLQKWYKFKPGDIIQSQKGLRFKLKPEASLDVANEMFLNYSALPSWAKIARVIPFLGAPFASFAAGASKNILRGVGYNLGYFNKTRQLIHEISGEKSPLERQALESPYYSNIKDNEAMLRLPFFKENPVYLNLGNAIHLFNLNMLEPPGRTFEDKYGTELVNLVDKSPFFKEPTGQFVLNYLVLPMLLGEAIGPFNNELYPSDASAAEKVGLTLTGAAEPFVPQTPGGLAALAPIPVPDEALPYVPSYRFRRLRNALKGRSAIGTNSSEPASSRTLRALSADAGLPVYRVNVYAGDKKK